MEIKLDHLTLQYKGARTQALSDVSALIGPGTWLLLGENGAGKTTLLHTIAGLLQPTEGTCTIDGIPASHRCPSIESRLTFLGDNMAFPARTVNEMIGCHAQFYPFFSRASLYANLSAFGLEGSEKLKSLSLGNRHKAQVAYMLALNTPLVLLDEPANGLDIEARSSLRRMLIDASSPERTIIVSTHTISDFEKVYDGVIILNHSRLQLIATLDDILSRVAFTVSGRRPETAIFSALSGGQWHSIISADDADTESDVDFELLYTALHCPQGEAILNLLTEIK